MLTLICCRRQQGVTLIELAVTLVILVILATIGMPSFTSFLRNTELRSASETVYQGMQLARAEAVRRNTRVRFVIGTDTGWTVATDAGTTIQSKPSHESGPNVSLTLTPTGATRVTFNSFGRVVANADASNAVTRIDFTATGGSISRRINIEAGGNISLCDPTIIATSDPRKC
ncbi:MAG TPA: GspH/FimT family pseudopilin [Armatimonadota bacterium]|nr:GspH/FimT family pseudopilin [Armatimonadota bacterium]